MLMYNEDLWLCVIVLGGVPYTWAVQDNSQQSRPEHHCSGEQRLESYQSKPENFPPIWKGCDSKHMLLFIQGYLFNFSFALCDKFMLNIMLLVISNN